MVLLLKKETETSTAGGAAGRPRPTEAARDHRKTIEKPLVLEHFRKRSEKNISFYCVKMIIKNPRVFILKFESEKTHFFRRVKMRNSLTKPLVLVLK